jgi:hypothetical protein
MHLVHVLKYGKLKTMMWSPEIPLVVDSTRTMPSPL